MGRLSGISRWRAGLCTFLLEEARRSYDGWVESNGRLEAKATWLTGFLAGGAGLLTVVGSVRGEEVGLTAGPFLALALIAALGALVCCLYILRPKLRPHPSVADYVSPAVAIDPKARFHLSLSLAEEYNRSSQKIVRLRRYDPIAWTGAQGALSIAVFAIFAHLWLSVTPWSNSDRHDYPRIVVKCEAKALRVKLAWALSCEDQPVPDKPTPTFTPPPTPPSSDQMHEGWTPKPPPPKPPR